MWKALKNRGKIAKSRMLAKLRRVAVKRQRMSEAADLHMMNFETRKVPLVFQQNTRAQRIIMRLDYGAARIVVVLPKRTSRQEGKRFALSNKDWIEERLHQLEIGRAHV